MILVAGGTGFVGAGIVRELARRGKKVVVLTRSAENAKQRFPGFDIEYRQGDVTDPDSLQAALAGVDAIVGAQQFPNSPVENPGKGHTFAKVDAEGTENLVRAAKAAGVKRYVYLSGVGAAPDGRHWFQAKWRAETAVRESGLAYTIIRPTWVYGPEDKSLNRFLGMSRFLPFVPQIGNIGKQRMQPVFIDDVGRAAAESLENAVADGVLFELGGPDVMSMKDVVKAALDAAGRRRLILPAPTFVMKPMATLLQFAPGRPLTPDGVDFITADALADNSTIPVALDLKLTPLRQGLATYMGKR